MATGVACPACGTELRDHAKFCDECGAPLTKAANVAEYKQVTVLFADVVRSMDIAAAIGPERLREIMSDLFDRCSEVVQQYGGTLDKFTGDGAMAIFGAPVSLEDHAIRACVAALDVQKQVRDLAVDVQQRDGIDLALRVGLNSGEVIAGEVGSRGHSYTTIGDQGRPPKSCSGLNAAREAIDWLTAMPTEPGVVIYEIALLRLRALLARACGDELEYRHYVDRYRAMANQIGFRRAHRHGRGDDVTALRMV